MLTHLAEVEPLLRRTCTHEVDATQPLASVVDQLASLARLPDDERHRPGGYRHSQM